MAKETKTTNTEKETKTMRKKSYKAYKSIRTILKKIRDGATAEEICQEYGICRATLGKYFHMFFSRSDTVNHYNRLLRENAKAKQAKAVAEVVESVRHNKAVEETAEVSAMIEPVENFPNIFIIDPILIQVHENRKSFGKIMEKLTSEHSDFVIYSKSRLEWMSEKGKSKAAAMLAKEILEDRSVKKAETVLSISEYSAFMDGIVITDPKAINGVLLEDAYEVISFEDFLKGDENELDSSEYARKFTIPITLNKMGRMICDLGELREYLEKVYGANSIVDVKIMTEDGKEKWTPTGKLMIKIGDTIKIRAVDNGGSDFTAKLSIIKNETVNNAVETYYDADADESSASNRNGGARTGSAM